MLIKLSSDIPIWQQQIPQHLVIYVLTDAELKRSVTKIALGVLRNNVRVLRAKGVPNGWDISSVASFNNELFQLFKEDGKFYLKKVS